jgi:error-prone DNA polymerase
VVLVSGDTAPASGFAELHCLSAFSFQRGASHAEELFERAKALGYCALAITDECSLAGIVRAHEAAEKHQLKLIVGCELQVEEGPKLVLLVPDLGAYESMSGLITHARRRSEKGEYRLLREDFTAFPQTAFAIWISDEDMNAEHAAWLRDAFPQRAWIGVALHHRPREKSRLRRLREVGTRLGLPLVACNDVRYHVRRRRALHDVMTAIRHGLPVSECGHRLLPNGEHHLRSLDKLHALYPQDLIDETLRIADRCRFRMDSLRYHYPKELVPAGHTPTSWLRELTARGIRERWPEGAKPDVLLQIEKELRLISELEYEAFFLTVHDIVNKARDLEILCQGRGSAANSVVCYVLGITAVPPEEEKLLFERFISKERHEAPDIDVDFEHQRREEIIQYVFTKYGRDRAAIAATVIHYRKKMALRDVGKALGAAPDQIDAFTKSLAWWDRPGELPDRMREFGLDPEAPLMRRWLMLTEELRGMPRHLSQHVGGFVISNTPVWRLVPIENAAMPDRTIIQWDKDDLESLGLLKVDVLALGMLSALRRVFDLLRPYPGLPRALHEVPHNDADTYDMICAARTVGVFQIESRAQMSMLPRLRPREFYDLVIQIAIVRPGPIQGGMVHPYLKQRQALAENPKLRIDIPQRLRKALGRTLGVPLFQEQVMQIAIDGADFTPGEADRVRRSMAAWKRSGGLEHFRDQLLTGMAANGFDAGFAESIYKMLLGFGSYGFPESHAASFAILAYASAWLKCHEPAAFTAGLINSHPMGFYAPAQLVQEARRCGVTVLPVDVTRSDWDCTLEERNSLRLGLRLVSGLSEDSARRIEVARHAASFVDLDDLVLRAQINARERNALADADALRTLNGHRHRARWAALGAERLPGMLSGHAAKEPQLDLLSAPNEGREILDDYASTGLTLRRHPVALLRPRLDAIHVRRAADLERIPSGRRIRIAGLVISRQRPQTAKGTVFMTLEDETGSHNLIIWDSVMESQRIAALRANFLIVTGELQRQQGVTHIVAQRFHDRSHWLGGLVTASRDFH